MRRTIFLLLFLPCALLFGAPLLENLRRVSFPTAGVIHPKEGTLEITVTPSADIKELGQGWPFAVQILGKENSPQTRTILGIYSPSRSRDGKQYGLYALIRTGKEGICIMEKNSRCQSRRMCQPCRNVGPERDVLL